VVPVADIIEHDVDVDCICGPDWRDDVIVHHSLDGRELSEADHG
jgi:hypothetical protein